VRASAGWRSGGQLGAQAATRGGLRGAAIAVSSLRYRTALFLIAVQALDGIGLGILDVLAALILADIMRGTGRYNVARGIAGDSSVGGSLSNVVAGLIVVTAVSALTSCWRRCRKPIRRFSSDLASFQSRRNFILTSLKGVRDVCASGS
jgi:hypothetical protein